MHKIYWIGDIHGCARTFKELLSRIPADCEVGLLGDINDRGSRLIEAINLALENVTHMIMGNHEFLMKRSLDNWLNRDYFEEWMRCGGASVAHELKIYHYDDFKQAILSPEIKLINEYLNKCQLFYSCDEYVAAHACIPEDFESIAPNKLSIYDDIADVIMWGKGDGSSIEETQRFTERSGKVAILGHHWACKDTMFNGKVSIIDTSCVRGGVLTAYEPLSGDVIHQVNID